MSYIFILYENTLIKFLRFNTEIPKCHQTKTESKLIGFKNVKRP